MFGTKYKYKLKFDNKGNSLISVMFAVAILTVVTLGAMTLASDMSKTERSFRIKNDALEFKNFVATQMSLPNVCKANFSGQTLIVGGNISKTSLYGVDVSGVLDSGKLISSSVAGNNLASNGLMLSSLQVANISLISTNTYKGSLKLNFTGSEIVGGANFTREFGIVFLTNAANVVQDCTVSGGVLPGAGASGGNCPARTHVRSGYNNYGNLVYQDLPAGFPTQFAALPATVVTREALGQRNANTLVERIGYSCTNGFWQDETVDVYYDPGSGGDDGN